MYNTTETIATDIEPIARNKILNGCKTLTESATLTKLEETRLPISCFYKGLQEDFEIFFVNLNYTSIERTVTCSCITSFFGIEERKAELTEDLMCQGARCKNKKWENLLFPDFAKIKSGSHTYHNIRIRLLVQTGYNERKTLPLLPVGHGPHWNFVSHRFD